MKKTVFILCAVLVLCGCSNFKESQLEKVELSDEQIESLCEQYAEEDDVYADLVPTKAMAVIEVFGVEKDGDIGYVYCFASDGTYVKVNNKAYDISGGIGPDILTIQFEGDDVLLLDRDDSVSSLDVLERFPKEYRRACEKYERDDALLSDGDYQFYKIKKEEAKKIEAFWGVPVEMEYCIDIFEDGTYEVWDFPEDESVTIETGKIETVYIEVLSENEKTVEKLIMEKKDADTIRKIILDAEVVSDEGFVFAEGGCRIVIYTGEDMVNFYPYCGGVSTIRVGDSGSEFLWIEENEEEEIQKILDKYVDGHEGIWDWSSINN